MSVPARPRAWCAITSLRPLVSYEGVQGFVGVWEGHDQGCGAWRVVTVFRPLPRHLHPDSGLGRSVQCWSKPARAAQQESSQALGPRDRDGVRCIGGRFEGARSFCWGQSEGQTNLFSDGTSMSCSSCPVSVSLYPLSTVSLVPVSCPLVQPASLLRHFPFITGLPSSSSLS